MNILRKLFSGLGKSGSDLGNTKLELERLLSAGDINNSIIELDNYVSRLCSYGEAMNKLSEPQKHFYYNQSLEREVNNGGFSQYFFNSSGDNAHQTVLSLRKIGADTTANILQKTIDQFPDRNVPRDRKVRHRLLEHIEDLAESRWKELEQEFFLYNDDLNKMNIEYIRAYKDAF